MAHAATNKMSIEEMIDHYQRSIERSENNPQRLLHCLTKLSRMDVTVQHLQATGIGRTVNQLRKDDGDVGIAAKALVAKWKAMVAADESSDGSDDDDDESGDEIDANSDKRRSSHEERVEQAVNVRRESSSSDNNNTKRHQSGSKSHHHHHQHRSQQHDHASARGNVAAESRRSSDSSGYQHHNGHHRDRDMHSHPKPHHELAAESRPSSSSRSNRKHSEVATAINGHRGNGSNGSSNDDEHNSMSTHNHDEHHFKTKHHHAQPTSSEQHPTRTEKHEREHHVKHANHKNSTSSHTSDRGRDDHKEKQRKSGRNSHDALSRDVERKHSKSSSSSSHHKRKLEHDAAIGLEFDETNPEKRHKDESSSSSRRDHRKSSKSSKHTQATKTIEIDNSMGTSFADALGMMGPVASTSKSSGAHTSATSNKHTSSSSKSTSSHSSSKHKTSVSSSSSKSNDSSRKSSTAHKSHPPALPLPLLSPKAELPDLPPVEEISIDLPPAQIDAPAPVISNNYRPQPVNALVMDCVFKQQQPKMSMPPMLSDEDALAARMRGKLERSKLSKVFSGKTVHTLPSLLELCLRSLQKNFDLLEFTGGIPYEILRPILERVSPEQLINFEHFNPYIMDDTDVLWKQHIAHKFRSKKREELESWRDMYFRCLQEQEERLNHLTNNIKKSQSVAVPVKQTKLAFIDSMVKPPRNVIKKQSQFGTERKLIATPAARTVGLSNIAGNISKPGDIRLRTSAVMRDAAQVGPSNSGLKARKAPLMAKTLQLMKGRFKR